MSNGVKFPKTGRTWADIEGDLDRLASNESFWRPQNRLMTAIHKGSPETAMVCEKAYMKLFHYNALLADMEHAGVGRMQSELLGWTTDLLNGGAGARASMMTGGTESIFCALHAAREWAKETRPDIKGPYQIVAPWSIHATFSKGAHYLGLEVIRVPLGNDLRANVEAMEKAITPNTIMLAGSAPSWGIGRVDPIEDIAKLAQSRGLWMHVDACVGGFLLPFMERCGEDIPLWDFRVPGVCTISADLHKHGYAAKPASTLSFRSEELQNYSFQGAVISDWQSGAYKSHGFVGSRPGGAVSAAWAVMSFLGEAGYTDLTRKLIATRNRMIEEIESIEDFKVLRNHCLMMPFRSETLDMLRVLGGLVERGYFPWGTIEPLMVHPSAELVDDSVNEMFLEDLREVVRGVKSGEITAEALATYI